MLSLSHPLAWLSIAAIPFEFVICFGLALAYGVGMLRRLSRIVASKTPIQQAEKERLLHLSWRSRILLILPALLNPVLVELTKFGARQYGRPAEFRPLIPYFIDAVLAFIVVLASISLGIAILYCRIKTRPESFLEFRQRQDAHRWLGT